MLIVKCRKTLMIVRHPCPKSFLKCHNYLSVEWHLTELNIIYIHSNDVLYNMRDTVLLCGKVVQQ